MSVHDTSAQGTSQSRAEQKDSGECASKQVSLQLPPGHQSSVHRKDREDFSPVLIMIRMTVRMTAMLVSAQNYLLEAFFGNINRAKH